MSMRWYQPQGRYMRRCSSASGWALRPQRGDELLDPARACACDATSTASGVATTTTSSRPTTVVRPSPSLWTRLLLRARSARPGRAPRCRLRRAPSTCQTASQVPTSDHGNETGSTPARVGPLHDRVVDRDLGRLREGRRRRAGRSRGRRHAPLERRAGGGEHRRAHAPRVRPASCRRGTGSSREFQRAPSAISALGAVAVRLLDEALDRDGARGRPRARRRGGCSRSRWPGASASMPSVMM